MTVALVVYDMSSFIIGFVQTREYCIILLQLGAPVNTVHRSVCVCVGVCVCDVWVSNDR